MSGMDERRIAPEMDADSRGFTVRWSKDGFASVLSCRFGFVLYLPPPAYEIRFTRYRGEADSVTWHDDRAGFAAVVVPELAGRDDRAPPPLVMLLEVRFEQRLEGLPELLSLVISRE